VRRRITAIFALLGFAVTAVLEALKGGALGEAVPRMIIAALAMAAVGLVAGSIAEAAVEEAIEIKAPAPQVKPAQKEQETDDTGSEES